jgi:ABC-type phosphate transport system permease subunit
MSVYAPNAPQAGRGRRSSPWSWRWSDRIFLAAAWIAGIGLCVIAAAIVLYMAVRGIQYLRPALIFDRPQAATTQAGSGGFLDPVIGTAILTLIGVVLALPLAVGSAVWRSSSSACLRRCPSRPKAAACTAARSSPPER